MLLFLEIALAESERVVWDTMLMIFSGHGNPRYKDTDAAHSSVLVFLFCERAKIKQQQQEKDNEWKLFHNPAAL